MRVSKLFGKTSKTQGKDLTVTSHRLLVQAGFIRESTAGRYYLLPLGLKVHHNIIRIIKQKMDAAGAQEIVTPTLHPLELWQETNRDSAAGFELTNVTDRRGAEFALGGTAEEMVVDLVRKFNISYKDLPFNVYQFSLKFRDELRARGGLLRVREFVMKDAYSFGTEEQFEQEYTNMRDTYTNIFKALGLETAIAEADSGYIGGDYCHEFIVDAEVGESTYFVEEGGDLVVHEDVAGVQADDKNVDDELADLTEVEADRGTTMEDGQKLHNLPLWQQIKDVMYVDEDNDTYVLAVIRGDLDVNETKLKNALKTHNLRSATEDEIRGDIQSEPGFISPVKMSRTTKSGKKLIVVGDTSLNTIRNAYGGANKPKKDLLNINKGRDYDVDQELDIALATEGSQSPNGKTYSQKKGIEVGNIFQLGYHYTERMHDALFTDEQGRRQKYYMGCYGIGIGRTLAAIAEVHADEHGLVWPAQVAPYHVYLVSIGNVTEKADQLYADLQSAGLDVLYDDRGVRPGEKFADADLLGIPYRVVISDKTLQEGAVELKARTSTETELIAIADIRSKLTQNLAF